jgi:hypothetical protein
MMWEGTIVDTDIEQAVEGILKGGNGATAPSVFKPPSPLFSSLLFSSPTN